MRLIDADHFIEEMEQLYSDQSWDDHDVHFSLSDLVSKIENEYPVEFTDAEKKIITMLFKIAYEILDAQNGYMDIGYESFSRNDMLDLEDKLGVYT